MVGVELLVLSMRGSFRGRTEIVWVSFLGPVSVFSYSVWQNSDLLFPHAGLNRWSHCCLGQAGWPDVVSVGLVSLSSESGLLRPCELAMRPCCSFRL